MIRRPHAFAAPLLALLFLTGCHIELQHALSEADANEIYVLLSKNGINAKKEKEEGGNEVRFMITVPKADAAQAAELLKLNSLPRPVEKGLAHFAKGSMVPTATEERAMLLKAMGGEVSNALNQIDGVLEARAIVMIPENNDLTQPENKPMPSASVFIKYRPGEGGKPPIDTAVVQQFAATAVPELKASAVTVLMTQALPPSAETDAESRLQDVLGLRMTAASASQFKVMFAGAFVLVLAMMGLTLWTFMRGGTSTAPAPRSGARARGRPPEA
ncbi:type III secretion system protein [Corallococcus macrosporus]|uniref:YscJ/HrcJ family type III secretion apparatus lipoprotein n=1 Tax=Myxococcus fulvus (strain ATCC BAA-855 / HW-1) TaxID=483219 RepID=F8CAM0_MYXFH|nr:type III secretion system protein [Corallococcus macrosporus]AEI65878.1 YscJ/HrcJ family type III secretion apparatus lipoprotein [Corallococcus macrosporus]